MITISDGEVSLGDPVANTDDSDAIGVLESLVVSEDEIETDTQANFRYDDGTGLITIALDLLRVLTDVELGDRVDALALADAQAVFDAASTALTAAGGEPCP